MVAAAWDALVPQTCAGCGAWIPATEGVLCEGCRRRVVRSIRWTYCPRCGRALASTAIHEEGCARCLHEKFWNIAGLVRLGLYEPPLERLVTGLKYGGDERGVALLAELLAAAIVKRGWRAELDYVIPVPTTLLRRWQRRCDHAAVLAAALAGRLDRPMLRAVRRVRHSQSQTRVPSQAGRFDNVRGCFAVRPGMEKRLAGKCVCIVDNVLVSGATMHEMAKAVRRAGARRIYAATVCRAALPGDEQAGWQVEEGGGEGG